MATAHDLADLPAAEAAAALSHIARNLRQQDRDEIEAMHGIAPELVLPQSVLLSSHGWLIEARGKPAGVFGAAPSLLPGVGVAWLLGTDDLAADGLSVARQTPRFVQVMQDAYGVLWNYVDIRNTVSRRWLEWGGFTARADHLTPSGHLFQIYARSGHV
ncbi:hypothetical protein QQS45_08440 [Alteriqipengyuania flavescens]|uniref:hypothetical protein n=1 Tax=Alteriqipengyuania flavescens TaxID=3053610 RepID=UPI0025B37B12|nr:hypothetical protein [Alteriqipengyuania flavescens]WJY17675.1 hypothetical protein QQW98_08435 [Alteriqipengyuania flavescens]WJY23618.1 hypothetical protein QQS45_08440 [Alteriqipengyuania flavescens]